MKLEVTTMRPVLILPKKQKGFCYGFFQDSYIVPPSLMVGGHNGGVVANPVAIVEVEGGAVIRVNPTDVIFCDDNFSEYAFIERKEEKDK